MGFILSAVNDVGWWHIFSLQNWLFDMIRGEESDTFGPFQIVASAHPSGLLCWASPADRNVRLRLKNRLATASKRWLEIHVYARQQRAESRPDCPANPDAAAGLAYIFLRRSIPSFTWLQAVTLAALLAALSAKDRVFTWCAAVQRPGPPQWNWNVNAYWAAVNTCNPAGPWGGIRKAEEIETTQGGPLSTEVSCLCVHGVNSSAASTPNITLPPAPPPPPRTVIILSAAKASSAPNPPQLHPSVQSFDFWKRYLLVMWPCCCCLLGGGFSHNVFFSRKIERFLRRLWWSPGTVKEGDRASAAHLAFFRQINDRVPWIYLQPQVCEHPRSFSVGGFKDQFWHELWPCVDAQTAVAHSDDWEFV